MDVLKAVRVDQAYTNLVLPAVLRHRRLSGGTPRSSPSWCRGRSADAARTTRSSPPAWTGRSARWRPRSSTRCGSGSTSCSRCGCRRTPRSARPWTWSGRGSAPGASGFANAVLRQVAAHDLDEWIVGSPPIRWPRRRGSRRSPTATRSGSSRSCATRSAGPSCTTCWPPTTSRPGHPRGRPGRTSSRDELPGEPTPWSPYGTILEGGDRADPGRRRGPRRRPGRGLAAGRDWRWPPHRCRRRRDLARPVRGTGRKGGAAGRARVPARRPPGRRRTAAAPRARLGGPVPRRRRRRPRRRRRGRHQAAVAAESATGSSSTRRAPGWGRWRRPEARWRRKPDDLVRLVLLQRALVGSA